MKRCAKDLGDQFGLALYNKGQTAALVGKTLVMPDGAELDEDMEEHAPAPASMGNDERHEPTDEIHYDVPPDSEAIGVARLKILVSKEGLGPEMTETWWKSKRPVEGLGPFGPDRVAELVADAKAWKANAS